MATLAIDPLGKFTFARIPVMTEQAALIDESREVLRIGVVVSRTHAPRLLLRVPCQRKPMISRSLTR